MGIKKSYFIFMKFTFLLLVVFNLMIFGLDEDEFVQGSNESFVDEAHKAFSSKIKEWGVDIDDMVLGIYDYFEKDNNATQSDSNLSTFPIEAADQSIETNTSYIFPAPIPSEQESDLSKRETVFLLDINASDEDNQSRAFLIDDVDRYKDDNSTVLEEENFTFDEGSANNLEKTLKDENAPLDDKVDAFFLTRKLLEEREKSYVRVTFTQKINSLEEEEFKARVKARVYLTRSRKRFKLFIENLDDDSARNIGKNSEDTAPSIGLESQSKEHYGIKPRYSIGFRGIDLFVRARYTIEEEWGDWNFKPVQTFQYSIDDEFSEVTELFLDRPISENVLLRFVADRGTETNSPGMRYDGFVQLFYKKRKRRGLSFSLGTNGSTKYQEEVGSFVPPQYDHKNKLFNYLFLMSYRQNVWKKWLFYEIAPGVNYHEQHDYRPNYNINFRVDLFFGHV